MKKIKGSCVVVHICNPSYMEAEIEDRGPGLATGQKKKVRLYLKNN
jgi:hypothetical protein